MLKDRGNIKWKSALMLPEHMKLLKSWVKEDELEKKPELDEQALDQIGTIVMESLHYTFTIRIVYWASGILITKNGVASSVDYLKKEIVMDLQNGKITIPIDSVVSAERV